jgi:hypothetical protein
MGQAEKKETNRQLTEERSQLNKEHGAYLAGANPKSEEAYGRSNRAFEDAYGGFLDLSKGKVAGLDQFGAPGAFGGGGYAAPTWNLSPLYGESEASYRNFMGGGGIDEAAARKGQATLGELEKTGGYDAATRARIGGDISGLRGIGETGGISAADQARARGGGIYEEFGRTGGFTPGQIEDVRRRATNPIASMYENLKNETERQRRIGGGSSAIGAAGTARLAREQARGIGETALGAETDIAAQQRAGRQWGAGGMSQSELALQQLLSQNKLAGLTGAIGGERGMAGDIAGTRLGAAGQLGTSEQNIQGMLQKGRMFGTEGLTGIAGAQTDYQRQLAEAAAAASASSGAASAADARFRAGLMAEGQQAGLQGLYNLRGQTPGEVAMWEDQKLRAIGQRSQLSQGATGGRINTNWWQENAAPIVGAAAGIAGSVYTGGLNKVAGGAMKQQPRWLGGSGVGGLG